MAPMMLISDEEFETIGRVYSSQIDFGSDMRTALNLATIVYQQRHPYAAVSESRCLIRDEINRRNFN